MKHIGNISFAEGAKHKKKRIGRGPGSGHGGTSTKGHKGQQSRSGYSAQRGFEGGQMPMNRRLPKFGFNNRFRIEYQIINLSSLQILADANVLDSNTVNADVLIAQGLIKNTKSPIKILGNGELTAKLNVTADKFSSSAKEKIESAGGTVNIHE